MNDFNVKVNSAGVAASNSSSSSVKTENATHTTLFSGKIKKDKSKLTENEIKYLVSQGYNISTMTEEDIEKALMPLYQSAETKTTAQAAPSAPANEAPATPAPAVEAQTEETPAASTAESNNTVAAETQQKVENQAPVQSQEEPAQTSQPEAQKKEETSKRVSPKEIKIDYNAPESRKFEYDLATIKEGVFADDYYSKFTQEEQAQLFVKALAMKECGKQWQSMTEEEQAQAMQTIEADLAEKIPSWCNLTIEDRAKLSLAFVMATNDTEAKALRYDGDIDKNQAKVFETESLDEQIEKVASRVIKNRVEDEKALLDNFNKEISARYGDSKEARRNLLENQLTYLQEKQAGGKELNKVEKEKLELLQNLKAIYGGEKWQRITSEKLNSDIETSTFGLMEKDAHYNEILKKNREKYYEQIADRKDATAKATKDAQKDWILHQFEGIAPHDKKAWIKKFIELRDNCNTIEDQIAFTELCREINTAIKDKINMCDDHAAKMAAVQALKTDANGHIDEEAIMHNIEALEAAHREGTVSGEAIGAITRGTSEITAKKVPEFTARAIHRFLQIKDKDANAAKAVNQATAAGVYSADVQKEIYAGALDTVKNKESLNVLAAGIGHTDDSIELEISKKYNKFAVDTQNSDMMVSLGEGLRFYSKDNQTLVMKDLMDSSYKFDDMVAASLQKGFADQVQYANKDNQLELHKQVMDSKFKDVQTHAASNIQYYDNSVKSAAIDVVYESGNPEALQVVYEIVSSFPPAIQKVEVIRAIAEAVVAGELSEGNSEIKILSGTLSIRDIAQLSPQERREYFIKRFEDATPAQKLSMMKNFVGSNMIGAIHKKVIYTMIARSSYLKDMVESGMGKTMLEAGLPIDAANKIINAMKVSTSGTVIQQRKELAKDPAFRAHFEGTFEEVELVAENESKQKYATPISAEFMKEAFTPVFIDAKTRAELMKNKSTMYIKS